MFPDFINSVFHWKFTKKTINRITISHYFELLDYFEYFENENSHNLRKVLGFCKSNIFYEDNKGVQALKETMHRGLYSLYSEFN